MSLVGAFLLGVLFGFIGTFVLILSLGAKMNTDKYKEKKAIENDLKQHLEEERKKFLESRAKDGLK